jgi:hypothetical protein
MTAVFACESRNQLCDGAGCGSLMRKNIADSVRRTPAGTCRNRQLMIRARAMKRQMQSHGRRPRTVTVPSAENPPPRLRHDEKSL